ncbi:glucans biosynthesis glucosyltransferase MdoH [Salinarimonas soli]|uniref:Glucans biosynthesis glucosyltransferase H n=1 Tax=Salinarimonas soli TaxID=1638099 RepID=A0A5B2VVH3_9HYPH|nr:glucans biosynthesis glucosyltransferase MdoH [Salinarimonas soli]KAA2242332.1 glucans biosynthesis glucosyltransferase MdoH [Salinarimonas soli]
MFLTSSQPSALAARRALLLVPSLLGALGVAWLSIEIYGRAERGVLDAVLVALFVPLMAWECFVVWQLVLGFSAWAASRGAMTALERRALSLAPVATGRSRTAVLIPIFVEDAEAVFAGVRVMARSLRATGRADDMAIHVLSDTGDPGIAAEEEQALAAYLAWAGDQEGLPPVHYRRRTRNEGRKAGNIAEWMERAGDAFDFMIVLDADSLMSGRTMRRLVRLMEEMPDAGIIQTVSYATGRQTLFARIQQFAVRLYAPLALRGLEFWQGPDGNYWGHNAIIRIAPFREHCKLPVLPGKPPFGGEILCHDIVEAALMRRAGYGVHLLPDIDGTWEEMPTNVIDLMGRERRWCQGNLQHAGVLRMPGLKPASRAHILLGIGGYLTAPLWWAFLLVGAVRAVTADEGGGLGVLAYGLTETGWAATALVTVAALLIGLPRVLNLARALIEAPARRGFGGVRRLLAGATIEQVLWVLLGPVLSLVNSGFVLTTLMGRVVAWDSQPRTDRLVPLSEAWARLGWTVWVGLALAAAALTVGGWYGLWMAPTALGLILAPVIASLLSRVDLGVASRRLGLFLTADDTCAAPELQDLRRFTGPGAAPAWDGDATMSQGAPLEGAEERP